MNRDGPPHRLLSVACAEPLTGAELMARMDERFGVVEIKAKTVQRHLSRLRESGFLHVITQPPYPNRYTLTPEGAAQLARLAAAPPPNRDRLLSAACAEPMSAAELVAVAERRGGYLGMTHCAASSACEALEAQGLLRRTRRGVPGGRYQPSLWVLTAEGEAELDALHESSRGKGI